MCRQQQAYLCGCLWGLLWHLLLRGCFWIIVQAVSAVRLRERPGWTPERVIDACAAIAWLLLLLLLCACQAWLQRHRLCCSRLLCSSAERILRAAVLRWRLQGAFRLI